MKLKIIFVLWTLTAVGIMFYSTLELGETATRAVPFKNNIENALQAENINYSVVDAEQKELKDARKKAKRSTVTVSFDEFLNEALKISDNNVMRKTFLKPTQSRSRKAMHLYWITVFDGKSVIQYEEPYTAPPNPLKRANVSFFKSVSDSEVVFRYNQWDPLAGVLIGLTAFILGFFGAIIYMTKAVNKRINKANEVTINS